MDKQNELQKNKRIYRKWLLGTAGCLLALWCGWRAFGMLSGRAYYGAADIVYAAHPLLRVLDIASAALLGCLAACLLAGWVALLRRRHRLSHALLATALAGCLAVELLYGGLRWLLTALSPLDIPAAGRLAAYILLMIVNSSYYKENKEYKEGKASGGEANEDNSSDQPIKTR